MATRKERLALRETIMGFDPLIELEEAPEQEELQEETNEELTLPEEKKQSEPFWTKRLRESAPRQATKKPFGFAWGSKSGIKNTVNLEEEVKQPKETPLKNEGTTPDKKKVNPVQHKVL